MVMTLGFLTSCSKAQNQLGQKTISHKNILIVYLSRTKNTKTVAEIIQKNTGGTLIELELQNPYPTDYKTTVDQVAKENETAFLPPIKTKIENMGKYDVVFIGFPTWGMRIPPPMKSFLNEYNLKGKTVIPFNTNAGYGVGSSFDKVKQLCPESKIMEGFSIKGGVEKDGILFVMEGKKKIDAENQIQKWLKKIEILN